MKRLAPVLIVLFGCGSSDTRSKPAPAGSPEPAAAPAAPTPASPGKVIDASFHSDALGVDKQYVVYLPGGYDAGDERYPVIYLLHGLGGSETNWTKHFGLTEAADSIGLRAIVVMPDGDDSFYVNWVGEVDYDACMQSTRPFGRADDMATYCVRQARYEDYIVNDLIAHVDATFRTIPERRARAISGASMGGYGALTLALRHKDVFASTASHAGVDALLYKGPYPYEKGKVELADDPREWLAGAGMFAPLFRKVFGEDVANWRAHDPAVAAESLEDGEIAIYLDCGTEDELLLNNGAAYLHEVLETRNVGHFFELLPGHHNGEFFSSRIDDSLRFHVQQFEALGPAAKHAVAKPGGGPTL